MIHLSCFYNNTALFNSRNKSPPPTKKTANHIQQTTVKQSKYRGADKSSAQPGRKQANVCQNGLNILRCLALQEKQLDDSSRLDVVEIARIPDVSEPVSFLVRLRTYQHPGSSLST